VAPLSPRTTHAALRRARARTALLVALLGAFLAICGTRVAATATTQSPAPIVLDLREGVGVGGSPQTVGHASSTATEGVTVADPTVAYPPVGLTRGEGVVVGDQVRIAGALVVNVAERVQVSDSARTTTGIRLQLVEGVAVSDGTSVRLPGADLYVRLSASPIPVNAGARLTYLITLGNNGPSGAAGARFTFVTAQGTSFVSMDNGFVCATGNSPTTLDCHSAQGQSYSIASGASADFHLVMDVATSATGTLTATLTGAAIPVDPDPSNNTASVTTPVNVAPVVTPAARQSASEGTAASFVLGSFVDDANDGPWSIAIDWGDGSQPDARTALVPGTLAPATHTYADGPSSRTVQVTVTDRWGLPGSAGFTIDVANVAPTPSIGGAPASSPEGTLLTLTASATDPSAPDTAAGITFAWTVTKDGAPFATALGASLSLTPDDDGSYVVTLRATDKDGGTGIASATIAGTNVAPTLAPLALSAAIIDENGIATISGSFTDPGIRDTHMVLVDWKDGALTTLNLPAGVVTFSATHRYLDDDPTGTPQDPYEIGVRVTDKDGGSATGSVTQTVRNVAPTLGALTAPLSPIAVGTPFSASATLSDPGTRDTFTAVMAWGDGTTTTQAPPAGASAVSLTHSYAAAGVFTLSLAVTDDDTGAAAASFSYLVAYDPSAGFVTGEGWINSPPGAYPADPSLAGRATFGFVSRYQKGQSLPSGNTEFQFQAASLTFRSTTFDWLVVAGARAQFKGSGTINGSGSYGFLLTANDGEVNGGGGTDRFRIKIWNLATGAVVYDNQIGAADGADPTTQLGGGGIVIHS
jgi:uncharacterized repeat protein (TIGR01451 family)